MRGYFGIGIWHTKTTHNVGTLWRTAESLGAAFMFTVGQRFPSQASDTTKAHRRTPLFEYLTLDDLIAHLPFSAPLIGVELDPRAEPLLDFKHPQRAVYLLGAEDHGLSQEVRDRCHKLIVAPGLTVHNVAMTGGIVMYDRLYKAGGVIERAVGRPKVQTA